MPRFAPEFPTTEELHDDKARQLTPEQEKAIEEHRDRVSHSLGAAGTELVVIIGPCAMTLDIDTAQKENQQLAELSAKRQGLVVLNRDLPWKHRSGDPDDPDVWFGLETTHPYEAYEQLHDLASVNPIMALEAGHPQHLARYGHLASFVWSGARNAEDSILKQAIADYAGPVGFKNDMTGRFGSILDDVNAAAKTRGSSGAAVAGIFRGGEELAPDPASWEKQLMKAYDSNIPVIVDVAHGGEMAHHPDGTFKKSVIGQIACLDHLIRIARETERVPNGIMIEASAAHSPVDPPMPFNEAIEKAQELAEIRQSLLLV